MDTALPQKFPFILDRNLAKANCIGNMVCTSCDTVVLALKTKVSAKLEKKRKKKQLLLTTDLINARENNFNTLFAVAKWNRNTMLGLKREIFSK